MPITAARTTRELATPEASPSMPMICGMPWPMMVMTVSSSSRPGNGHPGVHQALYRQVELATHEPRHAADQQRHQHAQGGGREAHRERHPRPVQQAG